MKKEKLMQLVPKNKFDDSTIKELMEIEEEEIQIIFEELFEWTADFNWPIAEDLSKVLLRFPSRLCPLLKKALSVQEYDDDLKYNIIIHIIPFLPRNYQIELVDDLKRIIENPTPEEISGDVPDCALEFMEHFEETGFVNQKHINNNFRRHTLLITLAVVFIQYSAYHQRPNINKCVCKVLIYRLE